MALLAVTTWRPAPIAASTAALAGPFSPPISSMRMSISAERASSAQSSNHSYPRRSTPRSRVRERAETAVTSIFRPHLRVSVSPFALSNCRTPVPTVPRPAIPSFRGSLMMRVDLSTKPRMGNRCVGRQTARSFAVFQHALLRPFYCSESSSLSRSAAVVASRDTPVIRCSAVEVVMLVCGTP